MQLYFCFDNRNDDNADGADMSDKIIVVFFCSDIFL